jgi:hypothetical protein
MKTSRLLFVSALLAAGIAVPAAAEKPQVRPYAAGSLSGGIPLWNPGDKFVAIAGGQCSGTCPVYELYVFDDGRVIFSGRKNTRQVGTARKQVGAEAYAELLTTVIRSQVLEKDLKRGTCLKGRPILTVMRSQPDGQSMIMSTLNPGCEKHADAAREIEKLFIQWTETEPWLAPP